jgi:hypothetical protein
MNTVTRRFILRLAVGLLAFLIGVTTAWAFGAFNPFGSSTDTRYYRHKHYWNEMSDADVVYPVYREHGCKTRGREFGKLPPPPPMPPSAPRGLR